MTLPLRNLPLAQNWDCHACSDCCRIVAPVTEEEKARIEALDLGDDPQIGQRPWFVKHGGWQASWMLRHRPDGGCIFLTAANRCRLQERFGAEVKPFACRLFPFVLVPAGDHWGVGLRYACPSAAKNEGRPIAAHQQDLLRLAPLWEKHVGRSPKSAAAPELGRGQQVRWPDLHRFVQALQDIVSNREIRLERRMRQCAALARVCRQGKFEKLSGGRLVEFLQVVRMSTDAEVPAEAAAVPPPGWIGRVLFRSLLAIFARRDFGLQRGPETRTRLGRLLAGWRFARGRGRVPRVNGYLPETTFAAVDEAPSLPPEIDDTLERYYLVKLSSLQFCGATNFGLAFWSGVEALIVTLPMILWLARAFHDLGPIAAVQQALTLVDDHFAGNPALAFRHNRFFMETLAHRGELEKLIAWYSR